jgi:hypothetical protein
MDPDEHRVKASPPSLRLRHRRNEFSVRKAALEGNAYIAS